MPSGETTSLAESLAASHARAPYSLVVAQLTTHGIDADLSAALQALLKPPRAKPKPGATVDNAAVGPPRVACVRGDEHPPLLWRMWVPSFCSLVFVRDLRLR